MRAGPDIVNSIDTNKAELSGCWLWSSEDVYSPDYLGILNKRFNQDTLAWDEMPISVEAVTIDFLRWKVPEAIITIRKTTDPISDVVWSGIVYTIPDDEGTGSGAVAKTVFSTGVFDSTVPALTDNGNGTVTVGSASVNLYLNSSFTGSASTYTVPSTTLTPTDNSQQFIVVDNTTGIPAYRLESDFANINHSNVVMIAQVWRVGTTVQWVDADSQGKGLANKISRAFWDSFPYMISKAGGLVVSETSTPTARTLLITSGKVYAGVVPHDVPTFDSSTNPLYWVKHVSGTWTYQSTSVYDNNYIDDGTDAVAVTAGNYSVAWIYRSVGGDNETYFVKSGTQYTSLALAEADKQRNDLPQLLTGYCKLLARVLIQQGAGSGTVQNIGDVTFASSGASSNHNLLSGLQGGTTGQYYHLTGAEHTVLTSPLVQSLGTLSSTATGFLKFNLGSAVLDTATYLPASRVSGTMYQVATFSGSNAVSGDSGFVISKHGSYTNSLSLGTASSGGATLNLRAQAAYSSTISNFIGGTLRSSITTDDYGSVWIAHYDNSGSYRDTPLYITNSVNGNFSIARPVVISSLGTGLVKSEAGLLSNASSSDLPGGPYQPLDGDLTSIAGLAGTTGLARKTAANTWALDTSTYLTANQSITWTGSGDILGTASGATTLNPTVTVTGIQGKSITLASGLLRYNGTAFAFDSTSYATLTSFSATSPILYNNSTGVFSHAATDGNLHVPATGTSNAGKVLTAGATAGSLSWRTPTTGTVTSVALSAPSLFTVTGSPVTGTGTLTFAFNGASTNLVRADGSVVAASTFAATTDLAGYLPLTAGSGKALTGTLYGSNLNFTSTTDSPLLITHNLAGAYTHPLQAFNSGMVAGNQYNFDFGQAASNYNSGNFGFKYVGAGSTSNYVTLGLYGANDLLKITGAGTATFSGSVVTPALSIGTLSGTLIGTSGVVSALSGTNLVLGNGTTIAQSTFATSSSLGNYLPLAGGTMTGSITSTKAGDTSSTAAVVLNSAIPAIVLRNSSGGTDSKVWSVSATPTQFAVYAWNDAASLYNYPLLITRSGTTITGVAFTTSAFSISSLGTGTVVSTSGTLSALSGTNLVLGNGTTIAQSTFATAGSLGNYLPLAGGNLNSGAQLQSFVNIAPSASSNVNYSASPLVVNRVSSSSTDYTNVAAIGFHNRGLNAAALYYEATAGTPSFKYNRHDGGIVTIFDNVNLTNLNQLTNGPGYITNANAANIYVTEHSSNNTNYPVVWDNGARSLYHTAAKMWFNPYSGLFAATAIASGSTLSWGGGTLRDHYADTTYFALYGSGVSSYGSNYTIAGLKNGQITWLGGSVSSGLAVNGQGIATATSTGLSITGELYASTNITAGPAQMSKWFPNGDFARFGHSSLNTASGFGYIQNSAGEVYLEAPTGHNIHLRVNGPDVATVSSTGVTLSKALYFNDNAGAYIIGGRNSIGDQYFYVASTGTPTAGIRLLTSDAGTGVVALSAAANGAITLASSLAWGGGGAIPSSDYVVRGNGAGPYGHRTAEVSSFNTLLPSGFYDNRNGISPLTTGWTHMIRSAHSDPSSGSTTWSFDLAANFYTPVNGQQEGYYVRVNEGPNWGTWRTLYHSGSTSITAGLAQMSSWSAAPADYARFGHSSWNTATGFGYIQHTNGTIYLEAPAGTNIHQRINGEELMIIDSSTTTVYNNLAVSNASVTISGGSLVVNGTWFRDQVGSTIKSCIYMPNLSGGANTNNYSFMAWKNGQYAFLNGWDAVGLDINNVDILLASATGITVTGTASVSGVLSAKNANLAQTVTSGTTLNLTQDDPYWIFGATALTTINLPDSPRAETTFCFVRRNGIIGNSGSYNTGNYSNVTINRGGSDLIIITTDSTARTAYVVGQQGPMFTIMTYKSGYWYIGTMSQW